MAFGLRPIRFKNGDCYNGAADTYFVPATDASDLFEGDPVVLTGDGDETGIPGVRLALAGERITGIIRGFTHNPVDNSATPVIEQGYREGGREAYVLVVGPDVEFEAQADAAGLTAADIGSNVDLVAGAGSTVTRQSGYAIDSASAGTASAQLRLRRVNQKIGNAIGADTLWVVSIVETTETAAAGTTGV